jgi:hypothetical protein
MPFINANQTKVLYGANALAAYLRSVTPNASIEMLDVTSLDDSAKTFIPGLRDYTMSVEGMFDTATGAGSIWDAITTPINAGSIVPATVAQAGFATGNSVWMLPSRTITYEVTSSVADVVGFSMSLGAGQPASVGVSLCDLSAVTATGTGSSVDNSSSSSNGFIAHLHVTEVSGTTPSMTAIIQHSTNGSTWSTLGTFTAVTSSTSQIITGTGTVNRYLRANFTISGTSPSFTTQISLARL